MPFTVDQFFDVFRRYNDGVWPAQVGLYALALAAVGLAWSRGRRRNGWIGGVLAFLWLWMAAAYHLAFFADINPAAIAFGVMFLVEAAALAWLTWSQEFEFRPRADLYGRAGGAFVVYALVVYPILGYIVGHRYPAAPTFGLPCPTTVFTFGVLLWSAGPIPLRVVWIPAIWSVIGTVGAFSFGVTEDFGLTAAGVLGTTLIVLRNRRLSAARLILPNPASASALQAIRDGTLNAAVPNEQLSSR